VSNLAVDVKTPRNNAKNVLVCFWDLVKGTDTMKRIYTLIVLMGLVMGALVTGCNKEESSGGGTTPTNATPSTPTPPPTTPPSTNK